MNHEELNTLLRKLPSVEEVLNRDDVAALLSERPRKLVVQAVRNCLKRRRDTLLSPAEGEPDSGSTGFDVRSDEVSGEIDRMSRRSLRRVINATGVLLHTNLGRAPLCGSALAAVERIAKGYCNLEFDLDRGERGDRHSHVEDAVRELAGCEAAIAVNNNAAAVLLALSSLARGREVVISRGELIEIGGSFRIPEIMAASGAILKEVGTTNRTLLKDYEAAVTSETALLLKVHKSNFAIVGFTTETTVPELAALGSRRSLPVMVDLGSGCLASLGRFGLAAEPTVQEVVKAGADLVTFSGDKLLGGPQAGIAAGRADLVSKLKSNPLARAVRIDKLSLAALEATLAVYVEGRPPEEEIPLFCMTARRRETLDEMAAKVLRGLSERAAGGFEASMEDDESQVGGGSFPLASIPTRVLAVEPKGAAAGAVEERLRMGEPPVVARVRDSKVVIDMRTLLESELDGLIEALSKALAVGG